MFDNPKTWIRAEGVSIAPHAVPRGGVRRYIWRTPARPLRKVSEDGRWSENVPRRCQQFSRTVELDETSII